MLIKKELKITIKEDKAILDQQLFLFQNDRNIDLYFEIKNLGFDFITATQQIVDVVASINATYSSVKILKPNGEKFIGERSEIVNNHVLFTIDDKFIDELEEIGTYKLQIQLYDDQFGRITIPDVEFNVLEPIFEEDLEIDYTTGQIDLTDIGKSTIANEEQVIQELESRILSLDTHGLTKWYLGDLISSSRMNKIHENIINLWTEVEQIKDDGVDAGDIDATEIKYENNSFSTVAEALDSLLYQPPSITSFTANVPTVLELGTIITKITFRWSYNKIVSAQSISGAFLTSNVREYVNNDTFSSNKTYTLTASDGKKTCNQSITFSFVNRIFYGVSSTNTYDNVLLATLDNELSGNKARTINVNASIGESIFYAVPSRLGNCIFTVGGFEGGFSKVASVTYSNSLLYRETYDIYKSDNTNLGNTTIVIR